MALSRIKKIRLIEFLVIGVVMGTIEDLIAVAVATDESIDASVFFIVILIAIPFAFISEVVVDNPRFWQKLIPEKIENELSGGKK